MKLPFITCASSISINNMEKTLIDLTYLRNFCDNDEEFIQEMIQTFLEKIPDELDILETALAKQDWTLAYQAVHSLKSSLYFIGLHSMSPMLAQMEEDLSRQKRLATVQIKAVEVMGVARKALEELKLETRG